MDIVLVKEKVRNLEQQKKRLPVYNYLKGIWHDNERTEDLTVLVMQQMVFYLIELESPWPEWENENEYQIYQCFLHEVLAYGFSNYLCEKKFLWNICFFLNAIGTYHFVYGDQIPIGSEKSLLHKFLATSKELFPTSVIFDLIPLLQSGDPFWKNKIDNDLKHKILSEVDEWNLRTNMVDEDLQEMFSF